jgi:catechol 2,3-dioxygenase-like lactoylglutathione lyase family enzyme
VARKEGFHHRGSRVAAGGTENIEMRMKQFGIAVVTLAMVTMAMVLACWAGETAGRAKILGIAYVKFMVTDVEKAKAFYGGILGLKGVVVRNGNFVQASFAVNQNQRVELGKTGAGTGGSYLAEIGLATDDVMKMRAHLTAKGVAANKIFTWPDGTKYFETEDPEHNKIVFVEQKWRNDYFGGAEEAISRRLLHAGFVVKDWKAESRFYEDVLGFRLYWKGGFKDAGLDWYEIQVPDGDNWIEYMLNIPANADHKELGVQNHFSLGVVSAGAAAEYLRKKGQKEFDGPEIGRDGKNALDVYDPDETRVEVMEFVPAGKPCCSEYTGTHPKP